MKVTRTERDGIAVLRLEGEFDAWETEQIAAEFDACLREDHYRILLDLEKLTFINSSTIAWLITAQKTLQGHEGEMVFVSPTRPIRKVLTTLGLRQVFRIFDSVDEAAEALRPA
ncbi:MAG: STAS domain-containing protein [Planctomycetota bacterium]